MVRREGSNPYGSFRERGVAAVGWNQVVAHTKPSIRRKQLTLFEVPPSAATEVLKALRRNASISVVEDKTEKAIARPLATPCASESPARRVRPLISILHIPYGVAATLEAKEDTSIYQQVRAHIKPTVRIAPGIGL